MTLCIGACKLIFTIIAVVYVDQMGRRPLLLSSSIGLCLFLIIMAIVTNFKGLGGVMVFALCAYMACFSLGLGPLTWVGTTEVFSTRIRAKSMSLAVSLNRLVSGVVASTTLPLTQALTPTGYFMFYAFLAALTGVYLYIFFPETKGRSLEEVEKYFEAQVREEEEKKEQEQRGTRKGGAGVVKEDESRSEMGSVGDGKEERDEEAVVIVE